jgi:hypothetical protein
VLYKTTGIVGDRGRTSRELRFVFLEPLLFPRVVEIPESPPVAIAHNGPVFYALTVAGALCVIEVVN